MKAASSVRVWSVAISIFVSAFAGCSETSGTDGGSETNWLKRCGSQNDCSAGNSCECGICTRSCESADECSDVPGAASCLVAESLDNGSCRVVANIESDRGICVAGCLMDSDCDKGSGFECIQGICVAILNDAESSDGSNQVDYGLIFPQFDAATAESRDGSMPQDADLSAVDPDAELNVSGVVEGDADTGQAVPIEFASDDIFPQCPCTVDVEAGTRAPKSGEVPDNAYGGPGFDRSAGRDPCNGYGLNSFLDPLGPGSMLFDTDPLSYEGLEELCLSFMICAINCSSDDGCPPGGSGSAVARCSVSNQCYLDCDSQRVCPDGMMCISGGDASICLWPQDQTTQGCPAFCEQTPIPRECPNFCASQLMACNPEKGVDCCDGLICLSEGYCVQE